MPVDYDYDQLYPGRFLKAGEFNGKEVTVTISDVEIEKLGQGKKAKVKGVVSFEGKEKQLALNRVNGECLKGKFGRRTGGWIGKRITLFPQTVEAFGAPTLAIRIKGSPDLAADMKIEINVNNNRVEILMRKTGQKAAANGKAPTAPATPPPAKPDHEIDPAQFGEGEGPVTA